MTEAWDHTGEAGQRGRSGQAGQPTAQQLRGAAWIKSSYSNGQGNCAEFARLPGGGIALRNSRFPEGPALLYTRAEVEALLLGAKNGEFDHLVV